MIQKGNPPDTTHTSSQQQRDQRLAKFLTQFSLIAFVLLFISSIGDVLFYLNTSRAWQLMADMTLSSFSSVAALAGVWYLARRQKIKAAAYVLLLSGLTFFPVSLIFLQGRELATFSAGFLGFILAVIVLWTGPAPLLAWIAASGLYAAYAYGLTQLNLVERYNIAQHTSSIDIGELSSGLFVVLVLWLAVRAFYGGNIRFRLLISFMILTSVPLVLVAVYLSYNWSQNLENRIVHQLESIAVLKETEIKTWLGNLYGDLNVSLTGVDAREQTEIILQNPSDTAAYQDAYNKLTRRFKQNIKQLARLEEIFLLDPQGKVILSTDPAQEGKIYAQQDFFQQSLAGQNFVQPPFYSPSLGRTSIIVSQPVRDRNGEILAVLAGRASLAYLNDIMKERAGLGDTGETYLVGSNHVLLTDSRFPEYSAGKTYIHTLGADAAVDNKQSGSDVYSDYRGEAVVGVYHWIPELESGLLAELDQAEARAVTNKTLTVTTIIVFLLIIGAAGVALWMTRSIINPLDNLAQTAVEIAGGNLTLNAAVEREDEVGAVAEAFNKMTARLRDLIDSLEQRVADRTQRLEIVAALGSHLSEILDFDQLLTEMVNQVKDKFNYYHAHVYIIDQQRKTLLMTAGAGEVGAQMKAQGHSISLNAPQSLVARAARTNQIVSVDNVRDASDWLPNPLLPDTWSEMAVPINVEGQVVGVLDVQEDRIAGFDESDANLLRSLANQVAVAIRNVRLFEQVETALAEARAAQERYLEQSWNKTRITARSSHYLYAQPGAAPLNASKLQVLTEVQQQALNRDHLAVVRPNADDAKGISLLAPVMLSDRTIGALQLHTSANDQPWTEDDLAVIEAVVDQLAQSAENLRLFDETRERAVREQAIREITDKLRAAPNLDMLLETAARELSRRLNVPHTVLEMGIDSISKSAGKKP